MTPAIDLSLGHLRVGRPLPARAQPISSYGCPGGEPELRKALAERHDVDVNEVVVTTGASMALTSALAALEARGQVLLPRPGYPAFERIVRLLGFEPRMYGVSDHGGTWAADLVEIGRLLAERPAALVWNFPHNPTGAMDTREQHGRLCEMASDAEVLLLSDRVYGAFVYDGERPALGRPASREVRLYSFSKSALLAGDRLGFVIARAKIAEAIERAHWALAMSPPAAAQTFALASLACESSVGAELLGTLRQHRDQTVATLRACRGLKVASPPAGIFVWVCVEDCPIDSIPLAHMCARAGVLVMPGTPFGALEGTWLRISFAAPRDELTAGLARVCAVVDAVRGAGEAMRLDQSVDAPPGPS